MDKDILSLKNIYRMLTVNDYPVYSVSVIGQKNRKGLTLLKFWQENLLPEFRSRHYGKMIWRNEGGRNRYISEICNRSERLPFYREYAPEIYAAASRENVLRQIRLFMELLREREYSYENFRKRLPELLACVEADDPYFSGEPVVFFRKNMEAEELFSVRGAVGQLFFTAWHLTFLTLHALLGEQMLSPEMQKFREEEDLSLEALWTVYTETGARKTKEVRWLTKENWERLGRPIPPYRFFGREQEMFDLRECLERGGHYLLTGEKGVGKTELLRQILRFCLKEGLVDAVGIVCYEKNLKESLLRAFLRGNCKDTESGLQTIFHQLKEDERQVLLLLDQMEQNPEDEQVLAELQTHPCVIFASSRLEELPGFVSYPVCAPSPLAGRLIFRDNYERSLTAEDARCLDELLRRPCCCQTLTLRLLGEKAKKNHWSVAELLAWTKAQENGESFCQRRKGRKQSACLDPQQQEMCSRFFEERGQCGAGRKRQDSDDHRKGEGWQREEGE